MPLRYCCFGDPSWNKKTLETYNKARQFLRDWRAGTWKYLNLFTLQETQRELVELMDECKERYLELWRGQSTMLLPDGTDHPAVSWDTFVALLSLLDDEVEFREESLFLYANHLEVRKALGSVDKRGVFQLADVISVPPLEARLVDM